MLREVRRSEAEPNGAQHAWEGGKCWPVFFLTSNTVLWININHHFPKIFSSSLKTKKNFNLSSTTFLKKVSKRCSKQNSMSISVTNSTAKTGTTAVTAAMVLI